LKVDEGEKGEGYVPAVIVDRHSVMDPVTLSQIVNLCRSIVHAAAGVVRIMTAFSWQPELPDGVAKTLSGASLQGMRQETGCASTLLCNTSLRAAQ
jgi:hypothetical protein